MCYLKIGLSCCLDRFLIFSLIVCTECLKFSIIFSNPWLMLDLLDDLRSINPWLFLCC
uniref:Uncharacterized protein n=1 Tax=Manihot esculenta TaxID=3983 RepID=A0A2C9W2K3_MANES